MSQCTSKTQFKIDAAGIRKSGRGGNKELEENYLTNDGSGKNNELVKTR